VGIRRSWGVKDLVFPSGGPVRFGLARTELDLARGWAEHRERAGEIRTIQAWVGEAAIPIRGLILEARLHVLDGSLEGRFSSEFGGETTLLAGGRGYALDLGMSTRLAAGRLGQVSARVDVVNVLADMRWDGSIASGGTSRPWTKSERACTGTAMSLAVMPPSLSRVRSVTVSLEPSGAKGPWGIAGVPHAAPWQLGLGAQLEIAPGLVGTGAVFLRPDRSPCGSAGARLELGGMCTDVAFAFDERLSVASRVMVTGRVTF
jgi:hypothetical protein